MLLTEQNNFSQVAQHLKPWRQLSDDQPSRSSERESKGVAGNMGDQQAPATLTSDWALKLQVDVAVQNSKLEAIDKKLDGFIFELKTAYASKQELESLKKEVISVKDNIGWVVKIILGAVVAAILSLIMLKGGGLHP